MLGRSEVISNEDACEFKKAIMVDYFFEVFQELRVTVYDCDDAGESDLSRHDLIGSTTIVLGELLTAPGQSLSGPIVGSRGQPRGVCKIMGEAMSSEDGMVDMALAANGLDNKDRMSKSDPYYIIKRSRGDSGTYVEVHRSEVIDNNLNPQWRPLRMSSLTLCNGDLDRPIRIEVWDRDLTSPDDLIGVAETSLRSLMDPSFSAPVLHPKKAAKGKYNAKRPNSGTLRAVHLRIVPTPTFVDFLAGGAEIMLSVGVDFTASNGHPQAPNSLHYTGSGGPNEYQQAIAAIGGILESYDSDHLFPAYGFGGTLPPTNKVSHCFALNGNPNQPAVHGVNGMLAAYTQAITNVGLSGPTIFAQLINHVAEEARRAPFNEREQHYHVLLIVTDGVITDMGNTKEAIINASHLPMSIIIVGVGQADFSRMDELDGDGGLLSHNGKTAVRDIVQFVPYREVAKNGGGPELARVTLAEVPEQVTGFAAMQAGGVQPMKRMAAPAPPPHAPSAPVYPGPPGPPAATRFRGAAQAVIAAQRFGYGSQGQFAPHGVPMGMPAAPHGGRHSSPYFFQQR